MKNLPSMTRKRNEYVRQLLKETLDGREIDMMHHEIETPHMIGVSPIGSSHSRSNEHDTILDPQHSFWEKASQNPSSRREIREKVERSIRILKEKDVFRVLYPYGEEAEVVYTEVDGPPGVECAECGSTETYSRDRIECIGESYAYVFRIDCLSCDYDGVFERPLSRR